MMTVPVKKMNLVSGVRRRDNPLFRKMIGWAFPLKNPTIQAIHILLCCSLLVFGHEQHNIVSPFWRNNSSCYCVKRGVAPNRG